jgi:sec-independent protein translocase protein TatC
MTAPRWGAVDIDQESFVMALRPILEANKLKVPDNPPANGNQPAVVQLKILQKPAENLDVTESIVEGLAGPKPSLKVLQVQEGLMIWMKVCFVAGFVLASPWVFYQLWAFIAAGLYPQEKKLVHVYLPFAVALFIGGVIFAQFLVIPQAVGYLLWINEWLGFESELRLSYWLDFALVIPMVFGIAFQTPLVMFLLDRIGLVTVDAFVRIRRVALFALTIVAAMLCAGDLWSMIMLTLVMFAMYEGGILLCRMVPKPPSDIDAPSPDEMIEV